MSGNDSGSGVAETLSSAQTERVAQILEDYLAELETGARPDAEALIARYPELGKVLRTSVRKLQMLHHAAACLRSPTLRAELNDRGSLDARD